MKAYTDIEQSKKLAEILPIGSADMCFANDGTAIKIDANSYNVRKLMWKGVQLIPCWSVAALLDYLLVNQGVIVKSLDGQWEVDCIVHVEYSKELVDACVEMILNLNKQKLL